MRPLFLFVLLASLPIGACTPARVQLAAPPAKDAPLDTRIAFYDEHRPSQLTMLAGGLLLQDGVRVLHPADLVPNVEPTSVTAIAALEAEAALIEQRNWTILAWTLIGGGIALEIGGLATATMALVGSDQVGVTPAGAAAMSVGILGAATGLAGVGIWGVAVPSAMAAGRETETAYLAYDPDLRRRLGLTNADLLRKRKDDIVAEPQREGPPVARLNVMAPSTCVDAAALRREVTARLTRDPFIDSATDEIHIAETTTASDVVVTLKLVRNGEQLGTRELVGKTEDCAELVARTALAISVLLDPLAPIEGALP